MLLPPVERRDEIRFYFAKSLPYNKRVALCVLLLFVGLGIQVASPPHFYAGLPFMLASVAIVLTKGYDNRPTRARGERSWRRTDAEQVDRMLSVNSKTKAWDQDFFDVTCTRGIVTLMVIGGVVTYASWELLKTSETLAMTVFVDAVVLLVPFWITGVRSILTNDEFSIKAGFLINIAKAHRNRARDGETLQFQVRYVPAKAAEGTAEVPDDIKAVVQFAGAPADFLGLQMQLAINSVQGTDYPYYYCVLVGKPGFGRLSRPDLGRPPAGITLECETNDDSEVAVIRQTTTKNAGFHTGLADGVRIFNYALTEARKAIAPR